jgi:hypothetical protein
MNLEFAPMVKTIVLASLGLASTGVLRA